MAIIDDEDEKKEDWFFENKKERPSSYQNLIIQLWEMLHLIVQHHHLKCYLFEEKMKHILVYLDQLMLTKKGYSFFYIKHKTRTLDKQ